MACSESSYWLAERAVMRSCKHRKLASGRAARGPGQTPTALTTPGMQFLGPGGDTVLRCYVHELYDGQRMRPEKLAAWRALRERYGNRDESRVDQGTLLTPAA